MKISSTMKKDYIYAIDFTNGRTYIGVAKGEPDVNYLEQVICKKTKITDVDVKPHFATFEDWLRFLYDTEVAENEMKTRFILRETIDSLGIMAYHLGPVEKQD